MGICVALGLLSVVVVLLLTLPATSATPRCATRPDVGLHAVPANTGPPTTLPASHDNDAGRAGIPDSTPDNDIDANQRPERCRT
jgi:hypothetical protein